MFSFACAAIRTNESVFQILVLFLELTQYVIHASMWYDFPHRASPQCWSPALPSRPSLLSRARPILLQGQRHTLSRLLFYKLFHKPRLYLI